MVRFSDLRRLHYTVPPHTQDTCSSCTGHRHFCTHTRERHKFTVEGAPVSCLRSSSESSRIPSSQASGIFGWTVGNFFFLWTGTPGGTPKATSQRPVGSRTRGFVCVKTREENFHTSQVSHRLSSVRLSPEHSESSRPHMSQDHTCGGRTDTENHLNE